MRFISIILTVAASFPASALQLGACYSTSETNKLLESEGQRIDSATGDSKILMSYGPSGTGYVLEARGGNSMCVVSVLNRVSTISVSSSADVCDDPRRYPGAVATCDKLKAQGQRVVRTVSADSTKSALSDKMVGPVNATFQTCVDKTGHERLCGRTETLANVGSAKVK